MANYLHTPLINTQVQEIYFYMKWATLNCAESEQQGPSWHPKKKGSASSDEGSVFARLEETRAELESQLGMDVFMEAYSECQVRQTNTLVNEPIIKSNLVVTR